MVACPKTYFQSGNFPFASNKERGKPKARNDDVTSTTAEVQPTKCVGTTINHIYMYIYNFPVLSIPWPPEEKLPFRSSDLCVAAKVNQLAIN